MYVDRLYRACRRDAVYSKCRGILYFAGAFARALYFDLLPYVFEKYHQTNCGKYAVSEDQKGYQGKDIFAEKQMEISKNPRLSQMSALRRADQASPCQG